MKILGLFPRDITNFQKQQIVRKFVRLAISLTGATLDSILETDVDKNINGVVIFDLHEQDIDIVEKIRQRFRKLPLLIVGNLSRNARIKVLQQGADYVVDQNTSPSQLIQILHALQAIATSEDATREISIRNLKVSLLNHDAWYQDIRLKLTRKEFLILRHLAMHSGQTISKDDLLNAIWNEGNPVNENSLEVLISRLRKKLSDLDPSPMIQTIYGVGYCLE